MATKTLTTPLLPNQVNIGTLQTPNILTTPTATTPIAPITPAPSNQPTITPSIIGTQPNVPPAPVTDTTHQNNLAVTNNQNIQNAQTHVDNVNAQQTGATTAPVSTSKTIADQLMNLIGIQGTQGQFTSNLQDQNDIAGKTKALNTANNDILTKSRAYDEQIKAIRDNPNGRTRDAVEGDVAALNQKKNDDIANLGIIAQTAQGNLNAANSIIDTKVKAKFEPINNQISSLEKAYSLYQNDMSESEKMKAQQQIDLQKDKVKSNMTASADVSKNILANAPVSQQHALLSAIDVASSDPNATPSSIMAAAGRYGVDQSAIDDHAYKMAQIHSLNASAAKKASSGTGSSNGSTGGVSTELAAAINNGTIDPNKINSRTLGIYNALAKSQIDAVGSHAGAVGESKAVENLSAYKSNAIRTLSVVEKNLPLVQNLADKVNTTGVPGLDAMIAGKKAVLTNNPDVVRYVNSLKTLRSEYAQMLSKGNVATESDKQEAANAIPAGLSSTAYAALGDQLKIEARNIIDSANDSIAAAKNKSASNNSVNQPTSVAPDSIVTYQGKKYHVDGSGNMTAI